MSIFTSKVARMNESELIKSIRKGKFIPLFIDYLKYDYREYNKTNNLDIGLSLAWTVEICKMLEIQAKEADREIGLDDFLDVDLDKMVEFTHRVDLKESKTKSTTQLLSTLVGYTKEDALMGDINPRSYEWFGAHTEPFKGLLFYIRSVN